jgi:hypothetical protein
MREKKIAYALYERGDGTKEVWDAISHFLFSLQKKGKIAYEANTKRSFVMVFLPCRLPCRFARSL